MILLEKYIKAFLKEAASSAIMSPASEITGKTQHQKSASYNINMTELNSEETLLKVLENVGNNCFISFVEKYDEKIPRLEVSPDVSYDTPHGNYAYPLNINSLKDIVEQGRIGGARFALDRPYFHMFKKSDSLNFIEIQPSGNNNYGGNLEKDLKTIVHTSVIYHTAHLLEREKNTLTKQNLKDTDPNIKLKEIKKKLKRRLMISNLTHPLPFNEEFLFLTKLLAKSVKYNNNRIPSDILIESVDHLTKLSKMESFSQRNMFFKTRTKKVKSDFHILYFVCYMLSNIISDNENLPNFEANDSKDDDLFGDQQLDKILNNALDNTTGPIFTMLLNSIDIDFINDKGSGTIHSNEPIQAVYLNSSKKENVVLVGTFNNIFKTKDINNIYELIPPIGESNKTVTMEKIIDILEQNPQLNNLFGTELFDDVKLENSIEWTRKLAWRDLTKKKLLIAKFIHFHSTNNIFNLNMYVGDNELIIFDIGLKGNFVNLPINEKIISIKNNLKKMAKIEHRLDYIGMFLNKKMWKNKNLYTSHPYSAQSMYEICDKVYIEMENYLANLDDLGKKENQEKYMTIKMFIEFLEQIIVFLQNLK